MSSFNSTKFSDAELDALSVWDAPNVSGKKTAGHSEAVQAGQEPTRVLTAEEIDGLQKQAFAEAFAEGKTSGYEEGYQQGFEKGSKQGYDENLHLLRNQTAELVSLLESLSEPFKALDERIEQELVNLAMGVAAQIIRREIKTDPGQVIAAVREAISILPLASQQISLHLQPEDAELVRSALALDEMSPAWKIIEEPLMTRGGCQVVTETSTIDATVENRTAAVIASALGDQRDREENL